MVALKRILLDVLKPHNPNNLELAKAIAAIGADYRVCLAVDEMDEKTETIRIQIEAETVDFEAVQKAITAMGGALHSIDEVEVQGGFESE